MASRRSSPYITTKDQATRQSLIQTGIYTHTFHSLSSIYISFQQKVAKTGNKHQTTPTVSLQIKLIVQTMKSCHGCVTCCCVKSMVRLVECGIKLRLRSVEEKMRVEWHELKPIKIWCYYMAKKEVGSDISVDLARESLIALSYSLPDTELFSTEFPKSGQNATEAVKPDGNEKLRSELISISYAESTDTKDSPVSPKQTNG
ncbi:hypothetical protein QVD17_20334 [Tagetes erecta]|uniref:Uncharacterized protein n=1 Tax=Tagetes erecta TaxID=13708 RepID=A0AAD8KRF9_TARER|nr:hypothetical protein QVD17_20334 [Tagetes erecta]